MAKSIILVGKGVSSHTRYQVYRISFSGRARVGHERIRRCERYVNKLTSSDHTPTSEQSARTISIIQRRKKCLTSLNLHRTKPSTRSCTLLFHAVSGVCSCSHDSASIIYRSYAFSP